MLYGPAQLGLSGGFWKFIEYLSLVVDDLVAQWVSKLKRRKEVRSNSQ